MATDSATGLVNAEHVHNRRLDAMLLAAAWCMQLIILRTKDGSAVNKR